jgi:dihydrofolate reductase
MINLIVAHTLNKAIGKNGDLVWKNKLDMQRFKNLTINSIVVMGKNT